MSDVRLVGHLDEGSQLNRPQLLADGFVGYGVFAALPEGLDHILDTDAAGTLAQQFLDQHVVADRDSLAILAPHVASLSQQIIDNLLGRSAVCNIIDYSE